MYKKRSPEFQALYNSIQDISIGNGFYRMSPNGQRKYIASAVDIWFRRREKSGMSVEEIKSDFTYSIYFYDKSFSEWKKNVIKNLYNKTVSNGWVRGRNNDKTNRPSSNFCLQLKSKLDQGSDIDSIYDWYYSSKWNTLNPEFLYNQYANDPEFTNRTIKEVFTKHNLSSEPLKNRNEHNKFVGFDYDYFYKVLDILTEEVDEVFAKLFNNVICSKLRHGDCN